jgi:hypothetical protein
MWGSAEMSDLRGEVERFRGAVAQPVGGPRVQTIAFYALLLLPALVWAAIALPEYLFNSPELSSAVTHLLVAASPVVSKDISIFGEVTPVILAGAIIALLPKTPGSNIAAIILAAVTYILYINLGLFFAGNHGEAVLASKLTEGTPAYAEANKTILSFVSNVRIMALVVAGSIIGLKVRDAS